MVNFLQWLQGYVAFECSGGFTERFLNLCKFHNLNLWNIKKSDVKVSAFTSFGEYKQIDEPAQRSGMEIKIVKKGGLPFFVEKHKWRFGIAVGCILMVLFIWFMSGFIWEVEIVPDNNQYIDGLEEHLEELGVELGARKSNIDILKVQEDLLDNFSQLSWVSLNIFGCKAQLEYTFAAPQKPIVDEDTFTNVVAKKKGVITLVEGYDGTNMVKAGASVAEGSLLISGVIKNGNNTERFVHARGKVFARTQNQIKSTCALSENVEMAVTYEQGFRIYFFGLELPLGMSGEYDMKTETKIFLQGNDIVLPVGFLRNDYLSWENRECTYTGDYAKYVCLLDCVRQKRRNFSDAQLESVAYRQGVEGDKFYVYADVLCVENIAKEIAVNTEKN